MIKETCYEGVKALCANYVGGSMVENRYTLAIPTQERTMPSVIDPQTIHVDERPSILIKVE
jgi:hypothetical protein